MWAPIHQTVSCARTWKEAIKRCDMKRWEGGPETNQSKGISWPERSSWSPSPEDATPPFGRSSWSPRRCSSRPCHSWSWLRCSTPSKWDGGVRKRTDQAKDFHSQLAECGYMCFLVWTCCYMFHVQMSVTCELNCLRIFTAVTNLSVWVWHLHI